MTATPETYSYRAARTDGEMERGTVHAVSREKASAVLSERGLFPVDLSLAAAATERGRSRIPAQDLALGLRVLATLLEAGLPISRAMQSLGELVPRSWAPAIPELRESVRQGQSLAASLASSSLAFPPVAIGIIKAGEGGSGLAASARRAAEMAESAAATRSALRSALAYPLVLAAGGTMSCRAPGRRGHSAVRDYSGRPWTAATELHAYRPPGRGDDACERYTRARCARHGCGAVARLGAYG
ncbi:MAG: type II secretion system F family protein [Gemmatimonadaceae bacterium]